jgi:pantoate--beta-alanine ligase
VDAVHAVHAIVDLRERLEQARRDGQTVGLVPTMGALHDGHGSLIRAAASRCDIVVTTIFVNPLQFAPTDDLDAYPRDLHGDTEFAAAAGAHVVFAPSVAEMYPFGRNGVLTNVSVAEITNVLDGAARPGHFDGVATVVAKLFAIAGPCTAFFGEKDWQQLAVVRRMALDLSLPVEIVGCPTVREPDGLAMSSRNRYLHPDDRIGADVVWRALQAGVALLASAESGASTATEVSAAMRSVLDASSVVLSVDYTACVDPLTLATPTVVTDEVRLVIAARVGREGAIARLIDNCAAAPPR